MASRAPQPDSQTDPNPPQAGPQPDPQAQQPGPADPRVQQLELQLAAERVANEFDIPATLFADAQTPEDIDRIASAALLWRAQAEPQAPPPPQTGAVDASWANGTGVIGAADRAAMNPRFQGVHTRDSLSRMSPAEILSAWRAGHLTQIGVGAPTRNGSTPLTRRG
jgi:hypothetical protein